MIAAGRDSWNAWPLLLAAHALLMVLEFQQRWLRAITGEKYRRNTIRTVPIGGSKRAVHSTPLAYDQNLRAVIGYVLKGALSPVARQLGLARLEGGGLVIGKRASTSQNIGRAARAGCAKRV